MPNSASKTITAITANERLSAYLRKQYDHGQQSCGKSAWPSLDCLPFNTWLQRTITASGHHPFILSESQELALWEKIISAYADHQPDWLLLRPFATAQIANKAWHLLKQWRLPLSALKNSPAEDVEHFYQWALDYQTICRKEAWFGHSDCAEILVAALKKQAIVLPQHLIFCGFEEVTPQIKYVCHALANFSQIHWLPAGVSLWQLLGAIDQGTTNNIVKPTSLSSPQTIALLDTEQELRTMARWAQQTLQQNPNLSIGCVIPELNTLRSKAERIFTEVFTAQNLEVTLPFNLSAGIPLSQYPLIKSALKLLQLTQAQLNLEQISYLLRSPFIGGAEQESTARYVLDMTLRQQGERYFTLARALTFSQHQGKNLLWTKQLAAFLALCQQNDHDLQQSYLPSTWANYFIRLLAAFDWPGERILNSTEFQQLQRWQALLREFTNLDLVINKPIAFTAAFDHLQQLAQHILFQPQTADVPIQVLGLLEATGMTFDRLWLMGMNDEYWPKSADPNPFIPIALQRQHDMPHASAERELLFSRKLTARFSHSSQQIIFSYSQHQNDTPLTPSTLIRDWPKLQLAELLTETATSPKHPIAVEYELDEQAPHVMPDEKYRGGANILKDQAACPFRAFANARLHVSSLPEIISGLSAAERGTLLHDILDRLWQILDNQANLNRYPESQLRDLIQTTITEALNRKALLRPASLKKRFIAVESQRLTQLIFTWLQLEKARPPFRISRREAVHKINFAGLNLSLRIDREDELADGAKIIVDYKTGTPSIDHWFGDRPDDPQLPLYCLTSPSPIQGLLFAQIRRDECQFKGISATEIDINGVKPISQINTDCGGADNWQDFQLQQRLVLTQLVQDFLNGKATVDPKTQETCRNCGLQMLCRIMD